MSTRTSRAFKGTVTGIIQNILSIIFQLVITPFIISYAGQEVLGGYVIILQIIGYSILLDFGFSVALTRYLSQSFGLQKEQNRFSELLSIGRSVLLITNSFVFIILILTAWNINLLVANVGVIQSQSQISLVLIAIWMVARTSLYVYNIALTATQDMASINIISIGSNLIRLCAALLFVSLKFGIPGLIIANILSELSQYSIQRIVFRKKYAQFYIRLVFSGLGIGKEMIRFGLSYWGVNLSVVFLLGSDNIIAGALYGAATASVFYSTKMLGSLIIQFISRIIDNVYPALNELIGKGDYSTVRDVYFRTLRYVLLLLIPSVLGINMFSETLVILWVGKLQYAGNTMAAALSLFVLMQVLCHLHGITVLALGNLRHWISVAITAGLLSVILGYSMGKFIGMQWILFGMAMAMLPILFFLLSRVFKILRIDITTVLKNAILPALYACMPLLVVMVLNFLLALSSTFISFSLVIILYLLMWALGVWILGITQNERVQILNLFKKTFQIA